MDLPLYARVIWRFKFIFFTGLIVAIGLTVISTAKVDLSHGMPKLTYRRPIQYKSQALLLVTQTGFPSGRSNLDDLIKIPGTGSATTPPTFRTRFADPNRFSDLSLLYSTYATSDPIRALMIKQGGPIIGKILANPLVEPGSGSVEPIIDLAGVAPSKALAISLARRTVRALSTYLDLEQRANHVPMDKRAILSTLNSPQDVTVAQGHKKTRPMFIFVTVMLATLGLCFILENVRPRKERPQEVPAQETRTGERTQQPAQGSRSASARRSSSA